VEDRSRHARNDHAVTCPAYRTLRIPPPTARWELPAWLGTPWRWQAGQGAIVLTRTAEP
jgi:hypothetical protein